MPAGSAISGAEAGARIFPRIRNAQQDQLQKQRRRRRRYAHTTAGSAVQLTNGRRNKNSSQKKLISYAVQRRGRQNVVTFARRFPDGGRDAKRLQRLAQPGAARRRCLVAANERNRMYISHVRMNKLPSRHSLVPSFNASLAQTCYKIWARLNVFDSDLV